MACLAVSVSEPATPVATETADSNVVGLDPLIVSEDVSPAVAFTHVFCRVMVADVRLLVIVQVTATGVAGTWKVPPRPSAFGVNPDWSQAICDA